jgi:DNA-binding transcriptional MerR regulator
MSNELISKKDLLDLTAISYGQLYRWKRKNLIPEEWFIRKATFTGQETFFPKDKILERINQIQTMKENLSLDELANMFSPNAGDFHLTVDELLKRNIVSKTVLDFYLMETKAPSEFPFEHLVHLYVLEKLLQAGDISLDEGKMLLQVLNDTHIEEKLNLMITIIRKLGISSCLLTSSFEDIYFEKGTKVIVRVSLTESAQELKTKII